VAFGRFHALDATQQPKSCTKMKKFFRFSSKNTKELTSQANQEDFGTHFAQNLPVWVLNTNFAV